jgi:hypothetical protein
MQTPFNVFVKELLSHGFLMRFQIAPKGFCDQGFHATGPASLDHILSLLHQAIRDLGVKCDHEVFLSTQAESSTGLNSYSLPCLAGWR